MVEYRFYFLDHEDKILRREDAVCADDPSAVATATKRDHAHSIEIWAGKRIVATVLPGRTRHED
ncbi:hypothetical protein KZX46_18265 [Polymorphobacter sp. PAMC 29334]|uniref:hypothetical protein n=1 Tax=Polymorphobacter sp. PAMC 29334 TaxID=2862331 RepID=UPI001C76A14B|nr:hypothetical protein [Polymorphobacter sp. PAMC 29334]QYE34676.1 hypothetical protein KZX46_18265 [Polymorphobacter sp. PAMC 29334]